MSCSSAYNPVGRRMAPLSKDTSGIILPLDPSKILLNTSNKIVDVEFETKKFKAAGEILPEIWSKLIIDGSH